MNICFCFHYHVCLCVLSHPCLLAFLLDLLRAISYFVFHVYDRALSNVCVWSCFRPKTVSGVSTGIYLAVLKALRMLIVSVSILLFYLCVRSPVLFLSVGPVSFLSLSVHSHFFVAFRIIFCLLSL